MVDSTVQENDASYLVDAKIYLLIIMRCWKLSTKAESGAGDATARKFGACIMAQRLRKDPRRREAARAVYRKVSRPIAGTLIRELEDKLPQALREETRREIHSLPSGPLPKSLRKTDKISFLTRAHTSTA